MTTLNVRYGRALNGALVFLVGDDDVYCYECKQHIPIGDYYTQGGKVRYARCKSCYPFDLDNAAAMAVQGRYEGDAVWARLDAETMALSESFYRRMSGQ